VSRPVRFLFVGAAGFCADAAMLAFLTVGAGLGPLAARCLSIGFAIAITWLLNRRITFGPSGRGLAAEGARYGGVGIGTSLFNYAVYSALILAAPALPPLAALAIASASAMVLSYLAYSRLVFDT
jgi:putative flippase GtrA